VRIRLNVPRGLESVLLKRANQLYKGGATDFLDGLSAQQTYLQDSDSLNRAKREHALAAVALYRSLGRPMESGCRTCACFARPCGRRVRAVLEKQRMSNGLRFRFASR
jgi:hypothetical protein